MSADGEGIERGGAATPPDCLYRAADGEAGATSVILAATVRIRLDASKFFQAPGRHRGYGLFALRIIFEKCQT